MEVILLEKIRNLGNLGDKVKVKPGYGRNYLIPYGKAVYASKENLAEFEKRRAEHEKRAAEILKKAQERAEKLQNSEVTIAAKVSEEGKLFGSITAREIGQALEKKGIEIEKREIQLSEGAIRSVGEYPVEIQLHTDVVVNLTVKIVAEE